MGGGGKVGEGVIVINQIQILFWHDVYMASVYKGAGRGERGKGSCEVE